MAQHGGDRLPIMAPLRVNLKQVTLHLASSTSAFLSEEGLALLRKGGLIGIEKLIAFEMKEK